MPDGPSADDLRRALHALDYERPRQLQLPPSINLGLSRLRQAAEDPRSPWAKRLRELLGRWRYGAKGGGKRQRKRALRADGLRNSLALLSAALASADVGSLLLAKPAGKQRPTAWAHRRLDELGFFAFGPVIEHARSTRREERAWRRACDGELVAGIERWTQRPDGEFRAKIAVKRLGAALLDVLELRAAIKRDRRELEREAGRQRAKEIESLAGSVGRTGRQLPSGSAQERPQDAPGVPGGPEPPPRPGVPLPVTEAGKRALREIEEILAGMK